MGEVLATPTAPQMTDVSPNRWGERWIVWKGWRSRWRPEGGERSERSGSDDLISGYSIYL